jgi:hypothetical protein
LDSGETFSAPIEIVRGETLGRAAVAFLDGGDIAVTWLELDAVKIKRVAADGSSGPVRVVSDSVSAFSVPQMLRYESDLLFAWSVSEDDVASVKTARVAIDSL